MSIVNQMIARMIQFSLILFIFFSFNSIFSQNRAIDLKKESLIAYEKKEYATAIKLINEMQSYYKEMPSNYLAIRIKSLIKIIENDPYFDYKNIEIARKYISEFLNTSKIKSINYELYSEIEEIKSIVESYPKSEISFLEMKIKIKNKDDLRKLNDEKRALEKKEREEKEKKEASIIFEKNELDRLEKQRLALLDEKKKALELIVEQKNKKKLDDENLRKLIANSRGVMDMGFSIYGGYNQGLNGGFDFLSPDILIGLHVGNSQTPDIQYGINTRSELALNLGFYLIKNKSLILKTSLGYTDLKLDYGAYPNILPNQSFDQWLIGYNKWSERGYTKFYYKVGFQVPIGKVLGSGFSPEFYFSNYGIGVGLGYVFCTSKK